MSSMDFKDRHFRKSKDNIAEFLPAAPPVMIRPSRPSSVKRMLSYPEVWLMAVVFIASWYFGAEALLQL